MQCMHFGRHKDLLFIFFDGSIKKMQIVPSNCGAASSGYIRPQSQAAIGDLSFCFLLAVDENHFVAYCILCCCKPPKALGRITTGWWLNEREIGCVLMEGCQVMICSTFILRMHSVY